MAQITLNHLTAGGQTSATSATTASISPAAQQIVIVSVFGRQGGATENIPTIAGAGMTWTQINTITADANHCRITLFRGVSSSPSSGAFTIDFAGQSQTMILWSIDQFGGCDISGTNGANAIVQSVVNNIEGGTASGLTVTLSAFSNLNNATFGAIGLTSGAVAVTKGANFTEITNTSNNNGDFEAQWANNNQTSVPWTWASADHGGVTAAAIELKAQPATGFFAFL